MADKSGIPVRILVSAPLEVGGVTSLMINIQRNLDRDKLNFDYVVLHDGHRKREDEVIELGSKKLVASADEVPNKLIRIFVRWKRIICLYRKNNVKILHFNGGPSVELIAVIIAKIAGVKYVTFHSHNAGDAVQRGKTQFILSKIMKPLMPLFVDEFWACSSDAAKYSFPSSVVKKRKYTFVPNGVNVEKFAFFPEKRDMMRKKLGLEGKFVIGHAGRFNIQKNHKFLIEIFKQVHEIDKDTVLLLLGTGELEEEIKVFASKLGLKSSIIFYGASSEMDKMYQAMDVFVMPSLSEGLPVAGIEAQVSGLPLILADSITKEVKINNNVEYLSLSDSAEIWATAILSYKTKVNERKNCIEEVCNAGFDEKQVALNFQEHYLNVARNLEIK